ncbi:MAG: type II 3-dehydroquinate dehydratase [Acidimicrobiia bacterium]|nr:type II 3-dehydroquinate dehydratase [Acidimicrobiia bacterium]
MQRIDVINGPNLNMLGRREPDIYGTDTLEQVDARVVAWGQRLGLEVTTFQSNREGDLIDRIQACRTSADGIVINAGALTHTSYAIHDALLAAEVPAVEVHLSNIHAREPWRAVSVLAPVVAGSIFGRGVVGYRDALRLLVNRAAAMPHTIAYGDHPEQVMDVRAPDDPGPHPVAVLVHGGFWRREWGRDTSDTLAVDLTARGWVTANVEYRRLGCDGGWPASVDDVATAIAHIVSHREVSSVTVFGHSSGGQLALVAGRATAVETVVALAPITDLAWAIELGTGAPSPAQFAGGHDPTGPMSPVAEPARGRQILVHGTADTEVPVEFSTRYVQAAEAAGITVNAIYPETGHFELLDPKTPVWEQVVTSL